MVHCCRYYEFEAVTTGNMRVGFTKPNSLDPGEELGSSPSGYVFDGMLVSSYKDMHIGRHTVTHTHAHAHTHTNKQRLFT